MVRQEARITFSQAVFNCVWGCGGVQIYINIGIERETDREREREREREIEREIKRERERVKNLN